MPRNRIVALSLPCFGDSSKNTYYDTYPRMAELVITFMDSLGLSEVILIGHSMSSVLAQYLAFTYPSRFSKIVLMGEVVTFMGNPFANALYDQVMQFTETYNLTLEDTVPYQYCYDWQYSTVYLPPPVNFMNVCIEETQKVPIKCWQAVLGGMISANYTDLIANISGFVFGIRGDKEIFDFIEVDLLSALVPKFLFLKFKDVGHAPHWEVPKETARAIKNFVDHWPS